MTATLHWIRDHNLIAWLAEYQHLLHRDDALLLSGNALSDLPAQAPAPSVIYLRGLPQNPNSSELSEYRLLHSDTEWVELTLRFEHQITW